MKLRVLQSRLLWGLAVAYVVPIAMIVPLFGHMPALLTYEARRLVLSAVVVVVTFGAFSSEAFDSETTGGAPFEA